MDTLSFPNVMRSAVSMCIRSHRFSPHLIACCSPWTSLLPIRSSPVVTRERSKGKLVERYTAKLPTSNACSLLYGCIASFNTRPFQSLHTGTDCSGILEIIIIIVRPIQRREPPFLGTCNKSPSPTVIFSLSAP